MTEKFKDSTTNIPISVLTISIGDCVRVWREFRKFTPSELAHKAGIGRSYIYSLEKNVIKQPNEEHLVKIADALEIDVVILLTRQFPSTRRETINENQLVGRAQLTLIGEIERQIKAAGLTEKEMEIITQGLLRFTNEMLTIIKATRSKVSGEEDQ